MKKPPAKREPCPDCGIGIVGGHMKRHLGSKVCAITQKRLQYNRELFSLGNQLRNVAQDMLALAEKMHG